MTLADLVHVVRQKCDQWDIFGVHTSVGMHVVVVFFRLEGNLAGSAAEPGGKWRLRSFLVVFRQCFLL